MTAACTSAPPHDEAGPVTQQGADAQHGALLYDTVCAACHTDRAHWRDKSVVHSWPELVYQVTRWQQNAGQHWSGDDIEDVAAYLNGRFYHLSCPRRGCSGASATSSAESARR